TPVPAVPPPPRAAVTGDVKPSALNAAAPDEETEMLRSAAVPVCSVIAPVVALMVGATPVTPWILESSVPTVSEISMLVPVVPAVEPVLTKVNVVVPIVMVLPAAKAVGSELLGALPDSAVDAEMGAGVAAWLK